MLKDIFSDELLVTSPRVARFSDEFTEWSALCGRVKLQGVNIVHRFVGFIGL